MNIHVLHFFRKNRSSLICLLLAVVLFVCLIGPLWSYKSAQTQAFGEKVYTLTGRPVYSCFSRISDETFGNLRSAIVAGFICCFFGLMIIANSIACLVIFGRTEYILKILNSVYFFVVTIAAMVMMIVVGGEIHKLEHPAAGEGIFGFLVGPGPICTFVFSIVGGVVNSTLLFLRLDGYSLKTMLHIQFKESRDAVLEEETKDVETEAEEAKAE